MLVIAAEIAVPIAILAAWQLWTVSANDPKFPRLSTILVQFQELWLFSQFETHVVPSVERVLLGFGIAVVVGVALGIPIGLSRWARLWAMPHVEYWRAMPPPALIPISIVLLHSIGNTQKVSFIAFVCLFPILLNTIDGVRGIEPTLVETARSYGIPWREAVRRIIMPAAMPQIFAGMRTSLSLAVIIMVLDGVLVEHERRRLRAPDLEEHLPARADVGGHPADRRARLRPQPALQPLRAPRSGLAQGLARGYAEVSIDA